MKIQIKNPQSFILVFTILFVSQAYGASSFIDFKELSWHKSKDVYVSPLRIKNGGCVNIPLWDYRTNKVMPGWDNTYLCTRSPSYSLSLNIGSAIAGKQCQEIFNDTNSKGLSKNPWICISPRTNPHSSLRDLERGELGFTFSHNGVMRPGSLKPVFNQQTQGLGVVKGSSYSIKCLNMSAGENSTKYLCGSYTLQNGEKPILDMRNDIFPINEKLSSRFTGKICTNETNPESIALGYDCSPYWGKTLYGTTHSGLDVSDWIAFSPLNLYNASPFYPPLIDMPEVNSSSKSIVQSAYRYRLGSDAINSIGQPWYPPTAVAFAVDPLTRDKVLISRFINSNDGEEQSNNNQVMGKALTNGTIMQNAPDFMVSPFASCSTADGVGCTAYFRVSMDIKINHAYMHPLVEFSNSNGWERPSSQVTMTIALRDSVGSHRFIYFNTIILDQNRQNFDKETFFMFDGYSGAAMLQYLPGKPTRDNKNYATTVSGNILFKANSGYQHFDVTVNATQFAQMIKDANQLIIDDNLKNGRTNPEISTDIRNFQVLNGGSGAEIFTPKDGAGYCNTKYTPAGKCFVTLGLSFKNFLVSYKP